MVKLSCFGTHEPADDWDLESNHSVESAPPASRLDKAARRAHALFPHKRVLTRQDAKQRLQKILNVKKVLHDRERQIDDDPEYIILGKIYSELDASVDLASLARNRTTLSHLLPFLLNALLYGFNHHTSTAAGAAASIGGMFYGASSSNRSAKKSSYLRINQNKNPNQITLGGTSHLVKAQCEKQLEQFLYQQAMGSLQIALECVWYLTTSLSMGPKESYHRTMTLLLGMEAVVATSDSPGDLFKKAAVTEAPSTQLNTEPNSENMRFANPDQNIDVNNNGDYTHTISDVTASTAAESANNNNTSPNGNTTSPTAIVDGTSLSSSSPPLPPPHTLSSSSQPPTNPMPDRSTGTDFDRLRSKPTVREVDLDITGSGENDHRMQFSAPLEVADEQKLHRWLDARRERANVFHAQLDFVKCLTHISQELFDVQREFRRDVLRRELEKLNDFLPKHVFIPTDRRPHRVLRIVPDAAHVFSTKERAPYLLVLEVEDLGPPPPPPTSLRRDDAGPSSGHHHHGGSSNEAGGGGGEKRTGLKRIGSIGHSHVNNSHNNSNTQNVNNSQQQQTNTNNNHHSYHNHHSNNSHKGFFGRHKSAVGTPGVFSDDEDSVSVMALQNKPESKFEFSPDVTAEVNRQHRGAASARRGGGGGEENDMVKRESSFRVADGAQSDDRRPPDEELLKALGEKWPVKSERLRKVSPFGHKPNWRLISCIVKARDQLRQEMFAQRLIQEFARIFDGAGIPLWLRAYEILSTSHDSGLIETVTDSLSIDSIKKQNKKIVTLQDYFFGRFGGRGTQGYKRAVRNFVQSMAGYSIVQYLLNIKDRHNGNLMIDAEGHMIHIDFGFLLSNSPGGNMEFEKAPFKLTNEMVQVMGGAKSSAFKLFKKLCVQGYLEACRYANKILLMVDIMYPGNESMPCFFQGREYVLENMRERFGVDLTRKERATKMLRLIEQARGNWTTKAYDQFQKVSLGIAK